MGKQFPMIRSKEMKGLIQLMTRNSGGPIWINPDYISSIAPGCNGAKVFIGNDASPVFVEESPEKIISQIQSLYQ